MSVAKKLGLHLAKVESKHLSMVEVVIEQTKYYGTEEPMRRRPFHIVTSVDDGKTFTEINPEVEDTAKSQALIALATAFATLA